MSSTPDALPLAIRATSDVVVYEEPSPTSVGTGRVCPYCMRPFANGSPNGLPQNVTSPLRADYSHFRRLPAISNTPSPTGPEQQQQQDAEAAASGNPSPPPANNGGTFQMNGYYRAYFKEIGLIGRGSFGGVFVAQHTVEGLSLGTFAVKKVPVGDSPEYLAQAVSEIRLLEEVGKHPNVVEYKHSWVEMAKVADFGPDVRCMYIVMEFANRGSLPDFINSVGRSLTTAEVLFFFASAVQGVAYLHGRGILHRDLKPENLLLKDSRGGGMEVLVSDFGTASLLENVTEAARRTGGTGTEEYMPPELKRQNDAGGYSAVHTKGSDVWALGQVLHYLAYDGQLASINPVTGTATVCPSNSRRPSALPALIQAMLDTSDAKRPTCQDILLIPLLKSAVESGDTLFDTDTLDRTLSAAPLMLMPPLEASQRVATLPSSSDDDDEFDGTVSSKKGSIRYAGDDPRLATHRTRYEWSPSANTGNMGHDVDRWVSDSIRSLYGCTAPDLLRKRWPLATLAMLEVRRTMLREALGQPPTLQFVLDSMPGVLVKGVTNVKAQAADRRSKFVHRPGMPHRNALSKPCVFVSSDSRGGGVEGVYTGCYEGLDLFFHTQLDGLSTPADIQGWLTEGATWPKQLGYEEGQFAIVLFVTEATAPKFFDSTAMEPWPAGTIVFTTEALCSLFRPFGCGFIDEVVKSFTAGKQS